MDYQLHCILRIVLAGLCGIAIGYERTNNAKNAGVRTHCIVACASALMMVLSKYCFFDVEGFSGIRSIGSDPSRISSQVVNGIGFLCAGLIFVHKNTIKGLTTAAGIWATSGIGMAIGGGMYVVGIASTFIILFVQYVFRRTAKTTLAFDIKTIRIYGVTEENFQASFTEKLQKMNVYIQDVKIERIDEGDGKNYIFYIEVPSTVNEEELTTLCKYHSLLDTVL